MRRAVFLVVLTLSAAACGGESIESDAVPAPTTSATTAPSSGSTSSSVGAQEMPDCPQAPDGSSPSSFDAASGTYAAHITAVDPAADSISFDVVQWLVGPDAVAAYQRDNPGDNEGPPNDYYVVNVSDEVRTAPVGESTNVLLVRLAEDSTAAVSAGTVDELPAYLAGGFPDDTYWLSFSGGEVIEICEQYRP